MKGRTLFKRRNKPLVFEGTRAEEYKKTRNKWIRLAVAGTGLPFIIGVIVSIFNDTFNLQDLFGSGELILLLFSLNLPMTFDLFDMKHKDDESLAWAFWACVVLICIQLTLYCVIRTNPSQDNQNKSLIASGIMVATSLIVCKCSLKALFLHSIDEGGKKSDI